MSVYNGVREVGKKNEKPSLFFSMKLKRQPSKTDLFYKILHSLTSKTSSL